jgi:formamidopyrimidine-DNA glycosylase
MPELPEVETTRRGIAPLIAGRRVVRVTVREPRLRWRIPARLPRLLPGQTIRTVGRRGKYLLLGTERGTLIAHLGMSGSLRVADCSTPPGQYDHVEIAFDDGHCLRLRDPRRFGALLWTGRDPATHPLLRHLGPEPLGEAFTPEYLYQITRGRRVAVRDLLLNGRVVAGLGNIYANEALFAAGIRPARPAGRLRRADCVRLVEAIRVTLGRALAAGGTTLRDFRNGWDEPGYFQLELKVYGRAGEPCPRCRHPIRARRIGQRRAFYCPRCQS